MSADTLHHGPVPPGRLRIYLGYAPGAGTTCALLSEGHRRAERGTDVVVASALTHGRAQAAGLLAGLEVIPPVTIPHEGTAVAEMNLGAVLARRPAVALVDDLAHHNVPGARHATRWQDVEDLLQAGIDVVSTVSIQHLESLADLVEKITGVPPPEPVPDPVVATAGEIELVDVAPETLRDRMARGYVYPAEQAKGALGGAFQIGLLAALRELALRWVAVTLASSPLRDRPGGQDLGSGHARERVVAAISGGPEGQALIRRAARIAARSGGELLTVHAAPSRGPAAAGCAALAAQRRLTEAIGGTYHQLADDDIPAALLTFARAQNATQLMLGTTRHPRLAALRPRPSIRSRVIRRGGGIDVHIVTCTPTAHGVPPVACEPNQRRIVMEKNAPWPDRVRRAARWACGRAGAPGHKRHRRRMGWPASAAVVAVALIVAACASSGSGNSGSTPSRAATPASGMAASGSALKTTTINGATVLTNAKGFTAYSFAPDTPAASKCNGSCAHFWPPVTGPATAGPGVTGKLGTIKRSDGSVQATYNGHPLYTYLGDTAPGQVKGNGLNAYGGIWHEVTAAPKPAAAHHRHHHARPAHPAVSTPPAPPATAPAQPANPIPQGNGGDHDADNNGGPSDGDGNL
jgi:predicted lipoprotein with Yx(FWY)xxD motif/nucleotide-binding universal stress UspA family protein